MQFLKRIEKAAKQVMPQRWRMYFRASKYELLMRRRAPVDLVVHIGAHFAEDAGFYEECGARTVLWSAPLAYGLAIALAAGLSARAMWMARQTP